MEAKYSSNIHEEVEIQTVHLEMIADHDDSLQTTRINTRLAILQNPRDQSFDFQDLSCLLHDYTVKELNIYGKIQFMGSGCYSSLSKVTKTGIIV